MSKFPLSIFTRYLWIGCLVILFPVLRAQESDDPINTQAELAQVRSAIAEVDRWLEQAGRQRPGYESNLRNADLQLQATYRQLESTRLQIRTGEEQQSSLEQEVAGRQDRIGRQSKLLGQTLRSIYYGGRQSDLKLVMNQENPATVARMLYYQQRIADSRQTAISSYRSDLRLLASSMTALKLAGEALDREQEQLAAQTRKLSELLELRKQSLAALDAEIASQAARRERLEADRNTLEALLRRIDEATASIPRPDTGQAFATLQGQLPWPAQGRLLSQFDDPYGDGSLRRQGVVIEDSAGNPVQAIHSGRVVFADWLRGYGLLTIVDHGDGYMSLYGYNQSLAKAAGDWVNAGEILARVGNSGDQSLDGVYFEIRHNGRPVNPLRWCRSLR